MAFWGAPIDDADHARHAVRAALAMQRECAALNSRLARRGWPRLAIGIGVNSGMVRVGDMGSRVRRAYTAMGDAVNVASRLEGRTKTYGVGILVGEATRSLIQDVVFREIDRIRVKGKEEAIAIYEPLEKESAELESWREALRAYRARQWDAAEAVLQRLQASRSGVRALWGVLEKSTRHAPRPAAVRLGRHHEIRREIGRRLKCAFVCSVAREGSADAICAQRPSFSTATF